MPKTSARSVAAKFIDNSLAEDLRLTNMQVQKMVYIANGLYLALKGEPLIREEVKVWNYGPVIEDLYHSLKIYGNGYVTNNLLFTYNDPLPNDADIDTVMNFTWESCKNLDGIQLSNWTHKDDSPWTKASKEHKKIIPNEYMEEFFKKFIKD